MKDSLRGVILIALAAFFWSVSGVFVRILSNIDTIVISFYKVFFGFLALFAVWLLLKRKTSLIPKKERLHIIMAGITVLLINFCFINAVKLSTISTAVLLFYTAPVFLIILGIIFLKEKIRKISIFSLLISLIGVLLISGTKLNNLFSAGIIFGVVGGFVFSLQLLLGKILSKKYSGFMSSLWMNFIATIFLIPFFTLVSLQQMFTLMIYGIISSGIAIACYFEGAKYVKAQVVGILILLDPIFATIWSVFLFNEPLTLMGIFGGTLILAAIVIQVIFVRNKNDSEET